MGGKVALELARAGADLDAVVSFHGSLGTPMPAEPGFKPMVLIANGAADTFVSAEEKAKFHEEMKAAGADVVFIDYAGALHAFTNPEADTRGSCSRAA
jgi:dienelactone hydrolase